MRGFIYQLNTVNKKETAKIIFISDADRTEGEPNTICKILYLEKLPNHLALRSVGSVRGVADTQAKTRFKSALFFQTQLSIQRIT